MEDCATVFHSSFGKDVGVIIDCFEVFIDRPSSLLARACYTWSSYKHHNMQGRTQGGGGSGGSGEPPFFKLIIFIAWLGMHV